MHCLILISPASLLSELLTTILSCICFSHVPEYLESDDKTERNNVLSMACNEEIWNNIISISVLLLGNIHLLQIMKLMSTIKKH